MAFYAKEKKGGNWVGKLHFAPKVENGEYYAFDDDELFSSDGLGCYLDLDERIIEVEAYKTKIFKYQLTTEFLYHMFIVFETELWYYSVEKDGAGITLQRSKKKNSVLAEDRVGARKTGLKQMQVCKGKASVRDLIWWIYKENELNNSYHIAEANCQDFARGAFECLTGQLPLEWILDDIVTTPLKAAAGLLEALFD